MISRHDGGLLAGPAQQGHFVLQGRTLAACDRGWQEVAVPSARRAPAQRYPLRLVCSQAALRAARWLRWHLWLDATPEATAFDRIRLGQARQQAASRQASAAEQAADAAREAEVAARLAREEAELGQADGAAR